MRESAHIRLSLMEVYTDVVIIRISVGKSVVCRSCRKKWPWELCTLRPSVHSILVAASQIMGDDLLMFLLAKPAARVE